MDDKEDKKGEAKGGSVTRTEMKCRGRGGETEGGGFKRKVVVITRTFILSWMLSISEMRTSVILGTDSLRGSGGRGEGR